VFYVSDQITSLVETVSYKCSYDNITHGWWLVLKACNVTVAPPTVILRTLVVFSFQAYTAASDFSD